MDLISMLTERIGVDESTARKGAGMIFGKAKELLGTDDITTLKAMIPGLDDMVEEAPEPGEAGGLMGAVSGMASKFGLGGAADLVGMADGLAKLGIPADKVSGFVQTILEFIETKGGADARAMIEKFIKV